MHRGLGLIVLTALLAACSAGGDPSPFAESRTPPGLAERFYPPEGWAWGFLQTGDAPAQRYGVAPAGGRVRADILILPDYGETAETWFETIHDLAGHGYRVWVLEAAGQGGSGRLRGPRAVGDVISFDRDIAAVRSMIDVVVRPTPDHPLFILAQGAGAIIAVPAAAGVSGVHGLVLSAPRLDLERGGPPPPSAAWAGDMKDAFARGATHDKWRGAVTLTWQKANPDLRMGGPSPRWGRAFQRAIPTARGDLKNLTVPVVVIEGDRAVGCLGAPRCASVRLAGGDQALELERDSIRKAWLGRIDRFVRGL